LEHKVGQRQTRMSDSYMVNGMAALAAACAPYRAEMECDACQRLLAPLVYRPQPCASVSSEVGQPMPNQQ